MTSRTRRTALRWLASLVAVAVFAGGGAVLSAVTSSASAELSPQSAATLLVDVQKARLSGLSGTIVQNADLGIPALPGLGGGGGNSADLSSLISGTHTLRVWYAGPQRSRISVLGDFDESDIVKNGSSLWVWSSSGHSATHWQLPSDKANAPAQPPAGAAMTKLTPQQVADAALKAISPSTKVTTNGTDVVAGRRAYLLTLAPRTTNSLVDSVQIAIDGTTHIPTRVRVYAKGHTSPAFEVGFTSFDPHTPPASVFAFNPPPGTKVTQKSVSSSMPEGHGQGRSGATAAQRPRVVGSGWSSVLVLPASSTTRQLTATKNPLAGMLDKLPKVSGSWGSGRILTGTLFTVLLTDNGRIAVGAVPPKVLTAALASR